MADVWCQFVVDGEWVTDHTAPQESDHSNNVNNVLDPKDIGRPTTSSDNPMSAMISGVTPHSTTAGLASKVPLESDKAREQTQGSSDLPGQFPETPAQEASEFNVNPIPATSGIGNPIDLAPGEKVSPSKTLPNNTAISAVNDDSSPNNESKQPEQNFGVNPLPATAGAGNPINLQPGEKIPDLSAITKNNVRSNITTDKESYERGQNAPQLPDVVTPDHERRSDAGMFNLPPVTSNLIPESSLPMGTQSSMEKDAGPAIQSAGVGTSTAALASQVPLEPRGQSEVLGDRRQLLDKKPENVMGSTSGAEKASANQGQSQAPATKNAATPAGLPTSVQESISTMNAQSGSSSVPAPTVPHVVRDSITDAAASPEAAADSTVVQEKSATEKELLEKVQPEGSQGEPAPGASAALTERAPTATTTTISSPADSSQTSKPATGAPVSDTKDAPTQSPTIADPNSSVTPTTASADVPAKTPATQEATDKTIDSRDISPMTRPETMNQTQPLVTSGLGTSATPASSGSAVKSTSTPTTDKKGKRASGFFGKLKAKFGDKEKK